MRPKAASCSAERLIMDPINHIEHEDSRMDKGFGRGLVFKNARSAPFSGHTAFP